MVNSNGIEATVLKAKHGSDIRKRYLHHQNDLNHNDLVLMMQRIFSIGSNESIQLKYRDSDGDWITIVDDNDIDFAIRTEPTFYVEVVTGSSQDEISNGTDSKERCNEVAEATKQGVEKNGKIGGIASSTPSQQATAKETRPIDTLSNIGGLSSGLAALQKSTTEQSWSTIANPPTPVSQGGGTANNVSISDIISDSSSASQLMDSPKSASANSIATIQPSVQETVGGPPPHGGFSTIYDGSTPPAQQAHFPPTSVAATHQFGPPSMGGINHVNQQFTAPTPPTTQPYYGGAQPPSGFTPPQHQQPQQQQQYNQATPPMGPQFGQHPPQQQSTPPISSIIGNNKQHENAAYTQSPQMKSTTPVQSNIYGAVQPPPLQQSQQPQAGMYQQQQPQNPSGQGFQQKAQQYPAQYQPSAQPLMQFGQQPQQAPPAQFSQPPQQQQGPPSSQPPQPSGIAPPPASQFGGNVSASGNPFARGPIGSRPASNFSNQY